MHRSSWQAGGILTKEILLNRMTNRIRQSLELQEILSATVTEIRSFLETDRVKVYRFEPDGSGEVIAESIASNRLPSLLKLRFPATDIPPLAREMFVKARQRSIISVPDQRITFSRVDCPSTTGELTLDELARQSIDDILQRPVDPCHIQYLTAMGVQSSLVVPILHQQELWGLLVSHHAEPKIFPEQHLQMMQILSDQVAIAISQSHLLSQARGQARQETLINHISTLLHAPLQIQKILQIVLEKIVAAVQGSGGRLYLLLPEETGELYTCGLQPQSTHELGSLEEHRFWRQLLNPDHTLFQPTDQPSDWTKLLSGLEIESFLDHPIDNGDFPQFPLQSVNDLYQEPQLSEVVPVFHPTPIRGLLVMPLWYTGQCLGYLTLFRNEVDTNILWAGRFDGNSYSDRVRSSFESWQELKRGQSQPWTVEEIELVRSLGAHLTMAVMQQRLYQCEREQRVLVEMRNQELHTARSTAEEASRLKSDFLSSTSHELRTPLASTLNYLKLLREGFYDNEQELQEYIAIAHQSAENLVDIINDVLDIAKIEAGRMSVHLESIALEPMLEEQQRLFHLESRSKNIALVIESEVERLYADRIKLRQILTNLLSNAFKFTHEGSVHVRCVHQTASDRQFVTLSATDTGIGIDAHKIDLLFEPFVQADGSIKRRYGGTGLGLTICKRLVELMNGHICLESPGRGQGTTVTLTLPAVHS